MTRTRAPRRVVRIARTRVKRAVEWRARTRTDSDTVRELVGTRRFDDDDDDDDDASTVSGYFFPEAIVCRPTAYCDVLCTRAATTGRASAFVYAMS